MKVKINKRFLKDLAEIPAGDRQKIEAFVFDESANLESIESAGTFEKLKGYHHFYRVRFGNYRVGVKYEDEVLTFERVLHRREIYRYFP
ncbi:type II toxin-antitoxin system RelE/ParE family toxin [Pontibacter sp. 172403-2]|uniref:type II toxin-antitoxin system RelE family toxin n=1 Tax=Pontibacter rufus TaxID=2791028 RepID=UPI0018AF8277|nr:type II toxin-antitoxin system RelE/ParE family toxin [Pontibacter sp. 172403-2]